ncbi:UNVERIFIED_CONTAM: hypothetical protein K2H54_032596 [Gekko kuhli]
MEGTRPANGASRCYGENPRANGRPSCCERCAPANKQLQCCCLGSGARVGLAWPGPLAAAEQQVGLSVEQGEGKVGMVVMMTLARTPAHTGRVCKYRRIRAKRSCGPVEFLGSLLL